MSNTFTTPVFLVHPTSGGTFFFFYGKWPKDADKKLGHINFTHNVYIN